MVTMKKQLLLLKISAHKVNGQFVLSILKLTSLEIKICIWNSGLATVLILAGIVVGIIIYLLGTAGKTRQTASFIGGENLKKFPEMRVSGVEFYKTIQDLKVLKVFYKAAERKHFDIYELGKKITFGFNRILSYLHNGVLPTYLAWCLLGMGILFYVLLR